jgi:hypothetical protein
MESDEEEDSELDDFIDDGPDEAEDYSKHIQDIFGYNRNRYANKTFFFFFFVQHSMLKYHLIDTVSRVTTKMNAWNQALLSR